MDSRREENGRPEIEEPFEEPRAFIYQEHPLNKSGKPLRANIAGGNLLAHLGFPWILKP